MRLNSAHTTGPAWKNKSARSTAVRCCRWCPSAVLHQLAPFFTRPRIAAFGHWALSWRKSVSRIALYFFETTVVWPFHRHDTKWLCVCLLCWCCFFILDPLGFPNRSLMSINVMSDVTLCHMPRLSQGCSLDRDLLQFESFSHLYIYMNVGLVW